MADAAEEKPEDLIYIKFSTTSNGFFSKEKKDYVIIFKYKKEERERKLVFNNIVIINLTDKTVNKLYKSVFKLTEDEEKSIKEMLVGFGFDKQQIIGMDFKTDSIDNTFLIKTIVSTGGSGGKSKQDFIEQLENIITGDIEIDTTREDNSMISKLKTLLRDKLNKAGLVGYSYSAFKHTKKLAVKKTKSLSKSLRKSKPHRKSLRKSKPRRKVKSPNQKTV